MADAKPTNLSLTKETVRILEEEVTRDFRAGNRSQGSVLLLQFYHEMRDELLPIIGRWYAKGGRENE